MSNSLRTKRVIMSHCLDSTASKIWPHLPHLHLLFLLFFPLCNYFKRQIPDILRVSLGISRTCALFPTVIIISYYCMLVFTANKINDNSWSHLISVCNNIFQNVFKKSFNSTLPQSAYREVHYTWLLGFLKSFDLEHAPFTPLTPKSSLPRPSDLLQELSQLSINVPTFWIWLFVSLLAWLDSVSTFFSRGRQDYFLGDSFCTALGAHIVWWSHFEWWWGWLWIQVVTALNTVIRFLISFAPQYFICPWKLLESVSNIS